MPLPPAPGPRTHSARQLPPPRPSRPWRIRLATTLVLSLVSALFLLDDAPGRAAPPTPEAPFAAIQYGTNGCIEVGVRPDAPYNQPRPRIAPAGFDLLGGYPAFAYDPAGFAVTNGTNACRYNFRNADQVVIGSGYCVQWARGQRSGTGYDPLPWDGTIANLGYVRRILADNWPAADAPAVPSTNATVSNRQRSGAVAMAIHYFTDRIVMPPDYQDPAIYAAVAGVVNRAIAAGPLPEPPDPRPSIDGPVSGTVGDLVGPYAIGSNAAGNVLVSVAGADAFLDAAGTQPFISGASVAPGTQLWLRATVPGEVQVSVSAAVTDLGGTIMVGDPTYPVQSMALALPLTLLGKAGLTIRVAAAPDPPALTSQVSTPVLESGRDVVDTFTVTGLGPTGAATVEASLYGPLGPGRAGARPRHGPRRIPCRSRDPSLPRLSPAIRRSRSRRPP